jgi:Tfp pilus assembly protein PilX
MKTRGVALYLVLAVLLVVVILSGAVLTLISSQSKISGHQVRRIQAYFAGQAGLNYAFEQLRLNNTSWIPNTTSPITMLMCGSANCPGTPNVTEADFPSSIRSVTIVLGPWNATTNQTPINATVNYTGY